MCMGHVQARYGTGTGQVWDWYRMGTEWAQERYRMVTGRVQDWYRMDTGRVSDGKGQVRDIIYLLLTINLLHMNIPIQTYFIILTIIFACLNTLHSNSNIQIDIT